MAATPILPTCLNDAHIYALHASCGRVLAYERNPSPVAVKEVVEVKEDDFVIEMVTDGTRRQSPLRIGCRSAYFSGRPFGYLQVAMLYP